MDATRVLYAFAEMLLDEGLVRKPTDSGTPSAPPTLGPPPLHVMPVTPPAPGERKTPENDDTLVLSVRHSSTLGEQTFDSYRKRYVFDIIYRTGAKDGTGPIKRAHALDAQIVALLTERPDYGLGWTMGTDHPVFVLSSQLYVGLSPVSRDNSEGATEMTKVYFEVQAQ